MSAALTLAPPRAVAVRTVDGRLLFALCSLPFALAGLLWGVLEQSLLALLAGALGVFVLWGVRRWFLRLVALNNEAIRALQRRAWEEAEALCLRLSVAGAPRSYGAVAVFNLGELRSRRGEWEEALACFEQAHALLGGAPSLQALRLRCGLERAWCLAALGRAAEAKAMLASAGEPRERAAKAIALCTAALCAYHLGDNEAAAALLERERVYLRNTLTGRRVALCEALERAARAKLAGAYRAGAAAPEGLPVDAQTRAFVNRVLPGSYADA